MGEFLNFLLRILQDQRGEVGDDPDGLGDPPADPVEPTEPTEPESVEPPDDSGEPPSDPEPVDDDDAPVPLKRFNKVYGEMKTTTEKFDLFKRLGPDKYYDVYPEEKPEEEPEEEPETPVSISEAAHMVITGGKYDGKTLGEVADIDPLSAMGMYDDYRDDQKKKIDDDARLKTESETEQTDFKSEQAEGLFGKKYSDLTVVEQSKIDDVMSAIVNWMGETGRGGGNLFDAHYLMNRESELSAAKGTAAANAVESITKGAVTSISGTKGSTQTGYGAYINLTRDQMADKLESMPESEKATFYEKAPANVRNKFPELPW